MARPKANVFQKVAAQQHMVVILYGYVKGRMLEKPDISIWECVKQFAEHNDVDVDLNTLYLQYKSYAAVFRLYLKDKDK
jgi:hypothetical protein